MTTLIGKRLAQARKRVGLSQKELGIKAGMDEFAASPRINQYERGKHTPDFETATRLAKVLKIPPSSLYTKDNRLAEIILLYGSLPAKDKQKGLEFFKKLTRN